MSNRAIAHRLGVTEKAIRKLMGPSKPAESAQLALPAITTEAEKPAPSGVPSATPSGEDEDRAMESARKTVTAPEAVNDDEPLPMSLDRDASDRTLDRQLAYLPRQPPYPCIVQIGTSEQFAECLDLAAERAPRFR